MPTVSPEVIVLATLALSLVLFVTDALRYEVVAVLVVLVLAITGCLDTREAFSSFASPAVVLIASMYVFGHAFERWGVADAIGRRFLSETASERSLIVRVLLVSGLLSAFLSNTGVVATLIPVCAGLCRRMKIPPSRIMMPMAFGSLLGGLLTLIGTSKNIAVNDVIKDLRYPELTLFEFSHLGLILLAVGALYFLGPGRALLPRIEVGDLADRYHVPKFVTEVLVEPSSTLINRALADEEVFGNYKVSVLGIVREGEGAPILAPGPYQRIREGDTLVLQGEPDDILRLRGELGFKEQASVEASGTRLYSSDVRLVEALIPSGSTLAGHTLEEWGFHSRTGLNAIGLARHGDTRLEKIQGTQLNVGDTLLIQGHHKDINRVRADRTLIVLEEVEQRMGRGALITIATLAGILILAGFDLVDLPVLALLGAVVLVLTRTVRADEVPRVVNWSVVALLGGMLALGKAFTLWHLDDRVADWLAGLGSEGLSPHVMLLVLLGATMLLTQVLNYVTTAVIMTPVAASLAESLGIDSRPFFIAVIAGSEFAFLSPVAHQCNAMVVGPGGYRYRHFLVVGAPLAVVSVAVCAVVIPWFWPFVPATGP